MEKKEISDELKLTKRQLDIIRKMNSGWSMFITKSEATGTIFYGLSKGFKNEYFRPVTFSFLVMNDLIYQGRGHYYELTPKAENYLENSI